MAAHDDEADRQHRHARQPTSAASTIIDPDRPDHLHEQRDRRRELPAEVDHREFEHDEPQAARHQKAPRCSGLTVAKSGMRNTREKHEDGRAEVRDPARKIKPRIVCARSSGSTERRRREVVAHVIERHQHDDEAAQHVGRSRSRRRGGAGACRRRSRHRRRGRRAGGWPRRSSRRALERIDQRDRAERLLVHDLGVERDLGRARVGW